jgi:ABC-type polysaccharide/polyol phosphate transport system ATPase subunit
MSAAAIQVDNLGKQYKIGLGPSVAYSTIREGISQMFAAPYQKVKARLNGRGEAKPEDLGFIWALKDVSFDIQQGEAVGIIGRNGAGKSTLLKILSRITAPTRGSVDLYGRVGSLLEVGTGFHHELTGRENIFLNGAILGMHRSEIERKFDEIVDFSEIEKFIDTPVKFYSSGMYMRLAFSVAAHLETEILLVDEVLAVGDIEFQKKCLGKMGDVVKAGRTILFVSHNMGAILSLCQRAILLNEGNIIVDDRAKNVVGQYLSMANPEVDSVFKRSGFNPAKDLVESAEIQGSDGRPKMYFEYGESLQLILKTNKRLNQKFGVELRIKNSNQELIGYVSSWIDSKRPQQFDPGDIIYVKIPSLPLVADIYYVDIVCRIPPVYHVDNWWDTIHFTVTNCRPGDSPVSIQKNDTLGSIVLENVEFACRVG